MTPNPTAWCHRCGEPTVWRGCAGERISLRHHECQKDRVVTLIAGRPWLRIEGDSATVDVSGALLNAHKPAAWVPYEPNQIVTIELGRADADGEWVCLSHVPDSLSLILVAAVARESDRLNGFVSLRGIAPDFTDGKDSAEWLRERWDGGGEG